MTEKNNKNDSRSVVSDIPETAFEEALRAVEKLEQEVKIKKEKAKADARKNQNDQENHEVLIEADEGELEQLMDQFTDEPEQKNRQAEAAVEPPEPAPDTEPVSPAEDSAQTKEHIAEEFQDAQAEPDESEQPEEEEFDEGEQYRKIIAAKDEQLKDLNERLQRVQADLENYRKRQIREKEEAKKFYNEDIMLQLLPMLDNFQRAFDHAKEIEDKQALQDGVQLIFHQFTNILNGFGLESVNTVGELFDPTLQEAMVMVEETDVPPGTVLSEYQHGYTLHGSLLRPAKVVVARAPGATSAPSTIARNGKDKTRSENKASEKTEAKGGQSEPESQEDEIGVSKDSEKG